MLLAILTTLVLSFFFGYAAYVLCWTKADPGTGGPIEAFIAAEDDSELVEPVASPARHTRTDCSRTQCMSVPAFELLSCSTSVYTVLHLLAVLLRQLVYFPL